MINPFEHKGKTYNVEIGRDECQEAPWEGGQCLAGTVSKWETRDKNSCERILASDTRGGVKLFYDFQHAVRTLRAEGLSGEDADTSANREFEFLRGYATDEWTYVYVRVAEMREDEDGYEYEGPFECLGGIESNSGEYLDEVAHELIAEIEAEQRDD